MREEIVRAVGALKKKVLVFHFWKQQYSNKNRSDIVVIVVDHKHIGSIPWKCFFS